MVLKTKATIAMLLGSGAAFVLIAGGGVDMHAAALFQFAEMLERVIHFIVATSLKDFVL